MLQRNDCYYYHHPAELLQVYRQRAVDVRGLIRVKIADEADVRQALQALRLLRTFVGNLYKYAAAVGMGAAGATGDGVVDLHAIIQKLL